MLLHRRITAKRKSVRVMSQTDILQICLPEHNCNPLKLLALRFFKMFLYIRPTVRNCVFLACFSARLSPGSFNLCAYMTTLLGRAAHFGSFGSASCPIALRRVLPVRNWQGQKFGHKTTSQSCPKGLWTVYQTFPPQSMKTHIISHKGGDALVLERPPA